MPSDASSHRQIPFGRPIIGAPEQAAVAEVLSGHMLTHGPKCAEFERRFAAIIGVRHAITTSSCTTALHLALIAHDVGPGDEVLVPAETHVATAHVVEHCGARPVFVDANPRTGNVEPRAIEAALTERTRAIMVVHYLGLPCAMDEIMGIADSLGLPVIEDCATALGAVYDGRPMGSFGKAAGFSFYPAKHITTMEGGMLVTDDDAVADRVRRQRAFGYDKGLGERKVPGVYDVVSLGWNYRMSEAQAAVGLCQLDRLPGFLEARRANAAALVTAIGELPEGWHVFPLRDGKAESGCYCVNLVLPPQGPVDRAELIRALNDAGIGTSVHYPIALPFATYYREKYQPSETAYPVARWISEQTISLPCGPHLDTEDMVYIGQSLRSILGRRS